MRTRPRKSRGSFLLLTAVMLAATAACVGFSLDVTRVFLGWRSLETQADAAALAAVMELDGTEHGIDRARSVVRDVAAHNRCDGSVEFGAESTDAWSSEGHKGATRVRVRLNQLSTLGWVRFAVNAPPQIRAVAVAEQRPADPPAAGRAEYSITAPDAEAADFGLRLGETYELTSAGTADERSPGRRLGLVAVKVFTGAPKLREIGWAAFSLSAAGGRNATFAGAYLQGSKRTGARPAGYYAAALIK